MNQFLKILLILAGISASIVSIRYLILNLFDYDPAGVMLGMIVGLLGFPLLKRYYEGKESQKNQEVMRD